MTIVPAQEAHRRVTRRRLTLDLLTRYGPFWEHIRAMRDRWDVEPCCRVPPEPTFHAETVGLLDRDHMPERFHMPPARPDKPLYAVPDWALAAVSPVLAAIVAERSPALRTARFLAEIASVWKCCTPEDGRFGTNALGFLSWAPFLSACVLFDPPANALLEFADHDDHEAAAFPHLSFHRDVELAVDADCALRDIWDRDDTSAFSRAVGFHADSFQESTLSPIIARRRGKPALDDLEAVQAALWKRAGLTYLEIGERGGWHEHAASTDLRKRKNPAISRVKRGEAILRCREYSA